MCVSGSCVLAEVINTGSVPRDALSCLWEHSTGDITRRSRGASFQFFVLVLEVLKKKKKVEQFQHFEASFFFFLLDFMCYVC